MAFRINEDGYFGGTVTFKTIVIPNQTILDAAVADNADIQAEKIEHPVHITYGQESATDATVETIPIHDVQGLSGTIEAFEAGAITVPPATDKYAEFDLLKNGVSVLSAKVKIDYNDTDRVPQAGTISTSALADGDILELEITRGGSTSNYPKGCFAKVKIHEKASAS